jgi:murein DD-endopeptidase MepM/ murein hydrolase activator NlpD
MRFLSIARDRKDAASNRGLTITIAASAGGTVRQYHVAKSLVGAVLGTAAVVLGGALVCILAFARVQQEAWHVRSLRAENERLRLQLSRVDELERKIVDLNQSRSSLLALAGVLGATGEPSSGDVLQEETTRSRWLRRAEPDTQVAGETEASITSMVERMPLAGPQTRNFGRVEEGGAFHTGVDIAGQTGAPVCAAGAGVVSYAGDDPMLGRVLVISHSSELESIYGHNSRILVRVGDYVTAGQQVAEVGRTGESSAPHLHFELRWQGKAVNPQIIRWPGPAGT